MFRPYVQWRKPVLAPKEKAVGSPPGLEGPVRGGLRISDMRNVERVFPRPQARANMLFPGAAPHPLLQGSRFGLGHNSPHLPRGRRCRRSPGSAIVAKRAPAAEALETSGQSRILYSMSKITGPQLRTNARSNTLSRVLSHRSVNRSVATHTHTHTQ